MRKAAYVLSYGLHIKYGLTNFLIRNALGYRAKDDHPLEVCLANPSLIKGAKCKIPLDICLENPEWLPLVGCSSKGYPLQVCLDYPQLLTSKLLTSSTTKLSTRASTALMFMSNTGLLIWKKHWVKVS